MENLPGLGASGVFEGRDRAIEAPVAASVPAARTARIDPVRALRQE
jgi:hypothetical protein